MRKTLLFIVCALSALLSYADGLTSGYYKIKCTAYSRYMSEDFLYKTVATSTEFAEGDYEKIWYLDVTAEGVTMQNVYTGNYIQKQTGTSQFFTTGSTAVRATLTDKGDGTYMFSSGSYMHCSASQGYNVVNWWEASSTASVWLVESVDITAEQVTAARAEYNNAMGINDKADSYNAKLTKIFTDLSCSELKKTYDSGEALEQDVAALGLPAAVAKVALKVRNQWSDETNAAYSEMFRIRDYKCYSQAAYWNETLKATQMGDMNNPTGIFTKESKEPLYVFVGSDIPEGCTLRLASTNGNALARYGSGVELRKGINVVQSSASLQQFYIMYTTSERDVELSTIPSLKIHIEGGDVLGFVDTEGMEGWYDNYTPEQEQAVNDKYKGLLDYANEVLTAKGVAATDLNYMVIGNNGIFMFPVDTYNRIWRTTAYNDYNYTTNYNIFKSIRWYDAVLDWQWGVMGFTKRIYDQVHQYKGEHVTGGERIYGVSCNNKAVTLQGPVGKNPYSSYQHTSMPGVGGVESSYNAERANFDNWCCAHESGHNNQHTINLPSCMESSNNFFSGVVCHLTGYRLSRGWPVSSSNDYYLQNVQFAKRDISLTHRMYYQLYLYYHAADNKPDFFPTLFKLLREDPLVLTGNCGKEDAPFNVENVGDGRCFLHIYKKCCEAAQEDLTEFFRTWGFFVPFENMFFGDYTNRRQTLTQAQIDEAIAYVKSKHWKENRQVIFIEDRIKTQYRFDPWAKGATDPRPAQGNAIGTCGTMGDFESMAHDASPSQSSLLYDISDNKLMLDGTAGGAGVMVYNKNDSLIAFGNGNTINLPEGIDASKLTIKSVSTDGTETEIKSIAVAGSDEQKLNMLDDALAAALAIVNAQGTDVVGYYYPNFVSSLEQTVKMAQVVKQAAAVSRYVQMAHKLKEEMRQLKALGTEKTCAQIREGNTYYLHNVMYPARYAKTNDYTNTGENGETVTVTGIVTTDNKSEASQWEFKPTEVDGEYLIKCGDKYINFISQSRQATLTKERSEALVFQLFEQAGAKGQWAIKSKSGDGYAHLHNDAYDKVVGWTGDAKASHWMIEMATEDNTALSALHKAVDEADALLAKVVRSWDTPRKSYPLTLQTTDANGNFYLSTNAPFAGEGAGIGNLVDDNTQNYFTTAFGAWAPNVPEHYLQLQVSEADALDFFSFDFWNRYSTNADELAKNSPTHIVVSGSNDGSYFTTIATITSEDTENPLPTTRESQSHYISATLGLENTYYKYIRFSVLETNTGETSLANQKKYFALSEFGVSALRLLPFIVNDGYETMTEATKATVVKDLRTKMDAGKGLIDNGVTDKTQLQAAADKINGAITALSEIIVLSDDAGVGASKLEPVISETQILLEKVKADENAFTSTDAVQASQITLQTTNASGAGYLSTNAQSSQEGPIANLIDGVTASPNRFHSSYSDNDSPAKNNPHYLQVDLGEGQSVDQFQFEFWSRDDSNPKGRNCPTNIVVSGSNDGEDFVEIATITKDDDSNPLPTATGEQQQYTSNVLGSKNLFYRYLRFTVMQTNTGGVDKNGNAYFSMAEFKLNSATVQREDNLKACYMNVSPILISAVEENQTKAQDIVANARTKSPAEVDNQYELSQFYNSLLQKEMALRRAEIEQRSTLTGKFGTICLPTSTVSIEGANVYTVNVNDAADAVVLTQVDGPLVEGVAYVYGATADTQTFTLDEGAGTRTPVGGGVLQGTLFGEKVPVGDYVMQTRDDVQKFYIVSSGKQPTLSPYKAYLKGLQVVQTQGVRMIFNEDDYETGVSAIESLLQDNARIYDLNGRELKTLSKGVNIVNGVKVIVK